MMIFNRLFFFLAFTSWSLFLSAQVEVDQPVHLNGADGDRMITNLNAPVNDTDAANKAYVDATVSDALEQAGGNAPDPCGGETSVTYYDQTYAIVAIGSQCWMAENLNTALRPNGTSVPRQAPNNVNTNYDTYGSLYKWADAMNNQSSSWTVPSNRRGICPPSWHIPSDLEWQFMLRTVGTYDMAGALLKSTNTALWNASHVALDSFGFAAIGAGGRSGNGNVVSFRSTAYFWSSTTNYTQTGFAITYTMGHTNVTLARNVGDDLNYAYSVRCVKD